jgi:hypothetical protein
MRFALAILLLAIGAALSAPAARRLAIERRSVRTVEDLRRFAEAFQAYASERGNWPPGTAAPGAVPEGMEAALAGTNWQHPTPIGGGYRWARHTVQRGERFQAAVLLAPLPGRKVTDDKDQLQAIDRDIDDGDLNSGRFRLGYRNYPVFVIEH